MHTHRTCRVGLWLAGMMVAFAAGGGELGIRNEGLMAGWDEGTKTFSLVDRGTGKIVVTDGKLEGEAVGARVEPARDAVFGAGERLVIALADGGENALELYPGLPFVLVRGMRHNGGATASDVKQSELAEYDVELDRPAGELRTLGTGGLLPANKNPGSYLFLTCADPASRRGVVAGWLTEDRGSGVFFSGVTAGQVRCRARIDYGHLPIAAGASAALETLAIGYFADARLGEEAYADAVRRQYDIRLRPPTAVYCTWYAEQHGGAGDAASTVELAKFAAAQLKPYGFGVVQVDDEWQDGGKFNGPRRGFDRVRPKGPYRDGMAPVAAAVAREGLTYGLWWLPFARNYQDPEYRDRQDWFVQRADSKPYDTAWGGTCLDLTHPAVREQLERIARLYRSWGVKYYKMDGLWTGAACEQIYVNDGYREDHFGNNRPFHDPQVSNVEAYRGGLKLLRKAAGDDVFFSGCCVAQNMRELTAIGLVDSMRIGPDASGDIRAGVLRGSRLYFLNGRVWWNDPDPAVTRAAGSGMGVKPVTLAEARLTTSWPALTGQFFLLSDWLPALPAERIEVLKRTMAHADALARPVDCFDRPLPATWLVTATNGGVRRDVIGLFNYATNLMPVDYSCDRLGLAAGKEYYAFDFWADAPLPPFAEQFTSPVPARSCRVIAVRANEGHPVVVSTSRHVTQGMLDVAEEKWAAAGQTLSGVSRVIGGDAYELRIAGVGTGRVISAAVSEADRAAGVTISVRPAVAGEAGWARVVVNAPADRAVAWAIGFGS